MKNSEYKIKEVNGKFAVVTNNENQMYGNWYKSEKAAQKFLKKVQFWAGE